MKLRMQIGALVLVGAAILVAQTPAQAAVPDRFGFALFSGGVVSEQFPGGTTVIATGVPGRWGVTFPGIGIPGGVVHVTAVHDALSNPPGRWCQADGWGISGFDEIVKVSCYRAGGMLDPTPGFSVLFTRSSGPTAPGHYGYTHSTAAGGIVTQYNSSGLANGVFHAGVGAYSVSFPGLGTPGPNDGGMQVTAVNPFTGARCKVAGWGSSPNGQFARIYCFNSAGAFADSGFTVSFQYKRSLYGAIPHRFGYLWNVPPLGPPSTNFNSSGVANGLVMGPPVWTASFPNIAASPGNVQVTAFGMTADFCGLHSPWVAGGVTLFSKINCFNNAGIPVNSGFFASYSSLF